MLCLFERYFFFLAMKIKSDRRIRVWFIKLNETMTHTVFSDTFSLSVSRSASVILATVIKLGASRWGPSLPLNSPLGQVILVKIRHLPESSSAGSLSWARTIQVTLDFTSSVWPWFLLIWSRPPSSEKSGSREEEQINRMSSTEIQRLSTERNDGMMESTFLLSKIWNQL